ncbi:DinB family protein [Hymenobacter sp. BT175]|uniref:DinB family protein n=1 Tax=Hymenobacter translucens TaxID=2886507 RepID=UPI001D0DE83E|nr:DinB family protein [Hymenobacter translucens]MCC2545864.1 DinB family protein [Hymenobacter translucens]
MEITPFFQQLRTATEQARRTVQTTFAALDEPLLNYKPGPEQWSILECLEHLNRYSRYYHPQLSKAVASASAATGPEVVFGWLGRKSLESVKPNDARRHKTLRHMNPNNSRLRKEAVLSEFAEHQTQLLELLTAARGINLNRKVVPIEFFKLLKLTTGETLQFLVDHTQRHLQQAERVRQGLRVELAV